MRRIFTTIALALVLAASQILVYLPNASAAFNQNSLIADSIYNNSTAMSASQIDSWLNTYFPNGCISPSHGFLAPDPTGYSPSGGYTYGGNVTAGQVIADAALAYGLNPQVILATLQKEQSLVSGTGGTCSVLAYTGAMGYGCPDGGTTHSYSGVNLYTIQGNTVTAVSGTCVNSAAKAGFSQQVIHAAWLLKFGQQRSLGNTGWNVQLNNFPQPGDHWDNSDDPPTCYGGPMTQGSFKRCSSDTNPTYYDGYITIDATSVHMDTGATAALYWYTPHFHGNQNFVSIFTGWFGNPNTACASTGNVSGAASGTKLLAFRPNRSAPANLGMTVMNNTGSGCAEVHLDNSSFTNWVAHYATGMKATDPATGTFVASKSKVDNQMSLNYINYIGGGQVEVHRMSPNLQKLPGYYDVPTNLSNVTSTSGMFVAGDFFGAGFDQLVYVIYSNNTGHVEMHMFDPGMRTAVGFYDIVSDLGGASATAGTFVAGDFLGRGYSQLAYVTYGSTEVHLLDLRNGRAARLYEVPTNLTGSTASNGTFIAGDFLGRGNDQLVYVIYNNGDNAFGGGVGHVETHIFDYSLTRVNGTRDLVTNIASFSP